MVALSHDFLKNLNELASMAHVTEATMKPVQAQLQGASPLPCLRVCMMTTSTGFEESERHPGAQGTRMISCFGFQLHLWALAFVEHWQQLGGEQGISALRAADNTSRAVARLRQLQQVPVRQELP